MRQLNNKLFSPLLVVLWNLLLVYLIYQIARIEYWLENSSYLNYTFDALYVVLMLFPLHYKETTIYHKICKWLFIIVNGLAFAINLADSVYFRYTMRRTTSTVFDEFSSEGNLGSIIGTEFLSHWYLVLLFALIMWLLHSRHAWRFCNGRTSHNDFQCNAIYRASD